MSDLWYFAYGSNLCRATFEERRGMRPVARAAGCLAGWRLCFDLPVGPGERGVANLVADPAASVHGVAYHLSTADAERLDGTEGVGAGYYRREPIALVSYDGAHLDAFTYVSAHGVAGRKPSARYMGLLLDGAREHALSAEWIRHLEAFDLAVDERLVAG